MAERARTSEVVAEFADNLDHLMARMLSNAFRDHVPAEELPLAVEAFRAAVQGTLLMGLDRRKLSQAGFHGDWVLWVSGTHREAYWAGSRAVSVGPGADLRPPPVVLSGGGWS